ncbi:MAG: hypothetical protein ABIS14_14855 [Sphingomonas sp.]
MRQFFGGLLLAIGILIMTGSGVCTVAVIYMGLVGGASAAPAARSLLLPLTVGGIPFAVGIGLFVTGRSLLKKVPPSNPGDLSDRFD